MMFYLFLRFFFLGLLFSNGYCCANLTQKTIYLTWQQSPSTTMTIQWITPCQDIHPLVNLAAASQSPAVGIPESAPNSGQVNQRVYKQSCVHYRPVKGNQEWLNAEGECFPFPQASQYVIHRVELKNLQPSTEYVFKVLPLTEEYRFLTAPSHLEKELRFVVGGDMYHDGIGLLAKTCQKAAQTSPLFALLGGDIAYAVESRYSLSQKIERWIDWIKVWHAHMVTPQGHLIPVIAAIGNHDLIGQYGQTPAQAAIFSALFPMPGKRIYNVLDFDSYLSIFILDSGHANAIAGPQTHWLRAALEERQQVLHRFAIYHVPAYPSVRNFKNKQSVAIRNAWVPLFEKLGIQAAFEHHDHAYKRTHPLLRGHIHREGIVYLGDGGWGVEKPRAIRFKRFYLAKFIPVRHFIAVSLTPSQQQFKCVNDQGGVLDEYTQPVKHKKAKKPALLPELIEQKA